MSTNENHHSSGFRWSFDEIRNIFVRGSAKSGERGSSTNSFHWSFSGTLDAIRSRFSSHERNSSQNKAQDEHATAKRARIEEDSTVDAATRRENRRQGRKGKSEKERDRRNNVNGLFATLSGLLGMEPGVKNKSQILANAKEFLAQETETTSPTESPGPL